MLVLLSILALFVGPLVCQRIKQGTHWLSLVDAFIFVSIGGLVLFHVLPEVLLHGGLISLVFVFFGLFGPSMLEKYFHRIAHKTHNLTLLLGVSGLVLHAVTDGGALVAGDQDHTAWLLALGVVLHRFPVGLTVWWLLRPQYGRLLPLGVLVAMSLSTLAGSYFGHQLIPHMATDWLAWFQALVTGSILHVVFHRPYLSTEEKQGESGLEKRAAGIGTLLGIVCLAAVLLPHWLGYVAHEHNHVETLWDRAQAWQSTAEKAEHEHETAIALERFISLALHSSPALLLAYFLTALVNYFKPPLHFLGGLVNSGGLRDSVKGTLLGLPLPVCVPDAAKMYKQLLNLGCGQVLAVSFLLAAPILGFDALLLTLPLLGEQWLIVRLVLAVALALVLGWLVGRWMESGATHHAKENLALSDAEGSRLVSAIKHGYSHLLDHTAPWVILGLLVAATLAPTPGWQFFEQTLWAQVILIIILALPFHLCATGMTPVVAVLLMVGLSPGAALALLLVGPTINLELFRFIKEEHGKRAAFALLAAVCLFALVAGVVFNQFAEVMPLPWLEHDHTWVRDWVEYLCLAVITVLYSVSLFKRGARAFLAELLPKSLLNKGHHHH